MISAETINRTVHHFKRVGLLDKTTAKQQCLKLSEEIGESSRAILDNDMEELKKELGDCGVVLINICHLARFNIVGRNFDYNESNAKESDLFKESAGLHGAFQGLFENINFECKQDAKNHACLMIFFLCRMCQIIDTDLDSCINMAMDKNEKRKGKVVGGNFIKQEDLDKLKDLNEKLCPQIAPLEKSRWHDMKDFPEDGTRCLILLNNGNLTIGQWAEFQTMVDDHICGIVDDSFSDFENQTFSFINNGVKFATLNEIKSIMSEMF